MPLLAREVETNTRVYTLYSSEFQQRMRVYFALREGLDRCVELCPAAGEGRRRCEQDCERVLDDYARQLAPGYAGRPEALAEVVSGAPSFDAREKPSAWSLLGRRGPAPEPPR